MSSRAFSEDYSPGSVSGKVGTTLSVDMHGNPLGPDVEDLLDNPETPAPVVAGRRVVGGEDQPLTNDEILKLAEGLTGAKPRKVPRAAIGGAVSKVPLIFNSNKQFVGPDAIQIANDLKPDEESRAVAHGTARAIDLYLEQPGSLKNYNSGKYGLRPEDIDEELLNVYRDQNNPGSASHTPINDGYNAQEAPHELLTEGIRAYLTNPNYIKTIAPNLAGALRYLITNHDFLRKLVRFNSLVPFGWLATSGASDSERDERGP
jgi:hypothetical protein